MSHPGNRGRSALGGASAPSGAFFIYASKAGLIVTYTPAQITQDQVVSTERCGEIIHTYGRNFKIAKVSKNSKLDKEVRKTLGKSIPIEHNEELYNEIIPIVLGMNEKQWKYILDTHDSIQILKYTKGCHYDWHIDMGPGIHETRKLSFIIGLSPAESYEGGEITFKVGPSDTSIKLEQGNMIVFPSFILHKVKPVTKGQRYVLVGWLRGNAGFQ
jgi:PKHD-type hydroxylase